MSISLLVGIVVGAFCAYRVLSWWTDVRTRGGNIAAEVVKTLADAVKAWAANTAPRETPLEQITNKLRQDGLEACSLIVAVDFTLSNRDTGRRTFGGKCLHELSDSDDGERNKYEAALVATIETLAPLDTDRKIPLFAFGCERTGGHATEMVTEHEIDCSSSVKPMLDAYRDAVRTRKLGSPTNFAPIILEAAARAKAARSFHILIIVCDGGVSVECMTDTCNAIAHASRTAPLGIVIVGVGDGPWETMKSLDYGVTYAAFDNVHFVEHERQVQRGGHGGFAAEALAEVPAQYRAAARLGLFRG